MRQHPRRAILHCANTWHALKAWVGVTNKAQCIDHPQSRLRRSDLHHRVRDDRAFAAIGQSRAAKPARSSVALRGSVPTEPISFRISLEPMLSVDLYLPLGHHTQDHERAAVGLQTGRHEKTPTHLK